ncbi:MAG TPA: outer membrane beta-barrel protein [Bacteroidia bacterium]|jgi:hypothetical protein
MRYNLAFFLFIFGGTSAQAQSSITVKVLDDHQKPLAEVLGRLLKSKDSSLVKYTSGKTDGLIQLENVDTGSYILHLSLFGYGDKYSALIRIDSSNERLVLDDMVMAPLQLGEITITAKVPVIQHYADRTVVNVQQSILTASSSVFDVIQRSPGIKIDPSENIIMVGKPGVIVMIDGKITPLSGSELANLLRGISADAVERIEFITNPSAKYDASGSAGIINIILKKDKRLGTNGTFTVGYGQGRYARTNEGFSLNRRTKKFNLFLNYNFSYSKNFHDAPRNRDFYSGDTLTGGYSENDYHTISYLTHSARAGFDFFANGKTSIGFIADGMMPGYTAHGFTTADIFDAQRAPVSYHITESDISANNYNYSGNLNMNHKFDSLGRELLVNLDYAEFVSHATQQFQTNYYDLNDQVTRAPYQLFGEVPGHLDIYSAKLDYDGKLGKDGMLEAGLKSSYVITDNNLEFYDGLNSSAPVDTGQSNHFIYSENINAGYVSYARQFHKWDLRLGLRGEQTIADGEQVTTHQTLHIGNFKLFPNIAINDSLGKNNQLGFSFSRRLDRPTYQQLNPFRNYVDPTTYAAGNPLLQPQYAYMLQLTETYRSNYSVSLNYTRTKGVISSVWMPITASPAPIIAETQVNLNYNDYYGLNASVMKDITSWWTTTIFADAYYTHFDANYMQVRMNTTKFYWDVSADNLFSFPGKLSLDINGFYSSGWDDGYLFQHPSGNVTVGLQKKVMHNRGTFKVNATDIFYTSNGRGYALFTGYREDFYIKRDTRVVTVSFSYHLGGNSQSRSMKSKGGADEEKKRAGGSS